MVKRLNSQKNCQDLPMIVSHPTVWFWPQHTKLTGIVVTHLAKKDK